MNELTHLSLFSGIGGLDIAGEWAGFRTVGQCEWADYPRAVLEKHWPGLPRWRDIRTLTKESFYEQTGLESVTVLSGGFPCQPFSTAGKRRGKEDDRYLWPEMLRVIQEIRPTWVVGENVAGIVSMALDTVLSDLEGIGYACQALIIPACAVDAPHRRDRCAILAYRMCDGSQTGLADPTRGKERITDQPFNSGTFMADTNGGRWLEGKSKVNAADQWEQTQFRSAGSSENVANPNGWTVWNDGDNGWTSDREIHTSVNTGVFSGAGKIIPNAQSGGESWEFSGWGQTWGFGCESRWPAEPDVGRVAHGVPSRVDRLKSLGNAVVPQQFYPIFKAIADIEKNLAQFHKTVAV